MMVSEFTYRAKVTENLMDYSHLKYALWQWQWQIANNNV
jgi:hypothetical protein